MVDRHLRVFFNRIFKYYVHHSRRLYLFAASVRKSDIDDGCGDSAVRYFLSFLYIWLRGRSCDLFHFHSCSLREHALFCTDLYHIFARLLFSRKRRHGVKRYIDGLLSLSDHNFLLKLCFRFPRIKLCFFRILPGPGNSIGFYLTSLIGGRFDPDALSDLFCDHKIIPLVRRSDSSALLVDDCDLEVPGFLHRIDLISGINGHRSPEGSDVHGDQACFLFVSFLPDRIGDAGFLYLC